MYINDLTIDLKCNVKLFSDDTSLFTVVEDPNTSANDMNHDLELISQWARDWKMSFNLGIVLDKELSFSAHIKEAISKTRKGIGILKYLSSYLPKHTVNELY